MLLLGGVYWLIVVVIINLEHWFGLISDFKLDLVNVFMDANYKLRLHCQLSALKQQTIVNQYTKQVKQFVLELGDWAPNDWALLFIFIEGLKTDIKMQVILARPQLLC